MMFLFDEHDMVFGSHPVTMSCILSGLQLRSGPQFRSGKHRSGQSLDDADLQTIGQLGGDGQRQRYGAVDGAQRHHVAQVLVLERQQRAAVDGGPHVPCHVVRLLECHLQEAQVDSGFGREGTGTVRLEAPPSLSIAAWTGSFQLLSIIACSLLVSTDASTL